MASVPNWSEMRHSDQMRGHSDSRREPWRCTRPRQVRLGCAWRPGCRQADSRCIGLQPVQAIEERRGLGRDVCGGGGKGSREEAGSRAEVEAEVEAEAEAEAKAEAEAEAQAEVARRSSGILGPGFRRV